MSDELALRYRPHRFGDVAGQTPVVAVLYRMAATGRVPVALLFEGVRGSGKTSMARILASAMNCETERGPAHEWPCTTCPSCKSVAAGNSLDVMEIDAASNGTVEKIKEIKDRLLYQPAGRKTVVLLDEAHSMSQAAYNQLLKTLEEPPPDTVFVLLTTEAHKILPTVLSRCMVFSFKRLPVQVIADRLLVICGDAGLTADQELLVRIAERADGAMRDAVMLLDQLTRVGISDLARYRVLMRETDFAPALVDAMLAGEHGLALERLDGVLIENADFGAIGAALVACLRDILRLLGGGTVTAQGEALAARQALAAQAEAPRVVAAMRVLWDLRIRGGKQDPRSALELAVVMCAERLARPAQAPPQLASVNGHVPLSIGQLQQMA